MLQAVERKGDGDDPEDRIEHDAVEHVLLDVVINLLDRGEDHVLAFRLVAKQAHDLPPVVAGLGEKK